MEDNESKVRRARTALVGTIVALAVASLAFRLLRAGGLDHTALVFVGIPALLAVALSFAPRPKSAVGTSLRVTALALLLSGVLFGEAFVCILFAAPIFFLVAGGLTALIDRARGRGGKGKEIRASALAALLVLPAGLEGVLPGWEAGREDVVTVVREVDGTAGQVRAALSAAPRFDRPMPAFLRLGFPVPVAAWGSGLEPGDVRRVTLAHGHHPGTLEMRVAEAEAGRVLFLPTADDTYVVHWLSWRSAEVAWREVSPGRTRVEWTLRWRRRLDPAWYFGPLERHGARNAAAYLVESLATPRS